MNIFGVGAKLALISLIFLLALAATTWFTGQAISAQKNSAVQLALAGRQRATIRRLVSEVALRSVGLAGEDPDELRQRLLDTVRILQSGGSTQVDILDNATVSIPAETSPEVLASLREQQQVLEEMVTASRGKDLEALRSVANRAVEKADTTTGLLTRRSESALDSIVRQQTLVASGAALLGVLFAWLVSSGILRQLGECVRVAQEIGNGNLAVTPAAITSADESARLARSLNDMLDRLRVMLGKTRAATESLHAASAQILVSVREQAAATSEQAAAVVQTHSTVQEVTQSALQIADQSRTVATSAESASSAGLSGLEALNNLVRAVESIREQSETVAETTSALSERTQAIRDIVTVVAEIAERSNLLALNAAIESSGAGEQGRRFSAVAAEMKTLAEQSKSATIQVRGILGEIQTGISSSVFLTEEAVKRVEAGREHSTTANDTIRRLVGNLEESVLAFQQIVAATGQQQIGFEQVALALRDIRQASEQAAVGTRQLEEAASSLTSLATDLRSVVESYRL